MLDIFIFIGIVAGIVFLSKKFGKKSPGTVSSSQQSELIKFGNYVQARLEKISPSAGTEFSHISDPRLVVLYLTEINGSKPFKVAAFNNHINLFAELKDEIFDVYVDHGNSELFFVDLQKIVNARGNIFFIPM
ncbi:MAG: hypothetical protein ACPGTS_01325 [Minisyncoccia bacterium]